MSQKKITKMIFNVSRFASELDGCSSEVSVRIAIRGAEYDDVMITPAAKATLKLLKNGSRIFTIYEPKCEDPDRYSGLECIGYELEISEAWFMIEDTREGTLYTIRLDPGYITKSTVVFEDGSEEVECPNEESEDELVATHIYTGRGDTFIVFPDECFAPRE